MIKIAIRMMGHVLFVLLLAMGCRYALSEAQTPFGWIGLAGVAVCVQACVFFRAALIKNLAIMLAFVLLPLALFEFYLGWRALPVAHTEYQPPGSMYQQNDVLGYGPRPGSAISAVRSYQAQTLFDVTYRVSDAGLRITPGSAIAGESAGGEPASCLLFFGGSFTFGEGLEDDQTVPAIVARLIEAPVRIYNFGFAGYGPHQMLSALEQGLVKQITGECQQVKAIYTGIAQHIGRVAGFATWDLHGPKYRLDSAGRAQFSGYFDGGGNALWSRLRQELEKSRIVRMLFTSRLFGPFTDEEINLYAGVVATTAAVLQAQYKNETQFKVLMWPPEFFAEPSKPFIEALAALEKQGLEAHVISSDILPDEPMANYRIHEQEQHPNAQANQRVARYVISLLEE